MRRKEREVSDSKDIEDIISSCDVCNIALSANNMPYIVPMNFGYCSGNPAVLYFHCASSGKKIDIIRANNKVWFSMHTDHLLTRGDSACDFSMRYRSVMGSGKITIVTGNEERKKGLNSIMKQYTGKENYSFKPATMKNTTILRLDISEITGKQVI